MSVVSGFTTDYDDDDAVQFSQRTDPTTVHLTNLNPIEADRIQRTQAAALDYLTPPTPHFTDRSLQDRVTLGPLPPLSLPSTPLSQIESDLSFYKDQLKTALTSETPPEPHALDFPNLAWEAVKAGLHQEEIIQNKLNQHIQEAEKHQKTIDLLLNFNAELTAQKEDATEMTEKMKNLLSELKEYGIDLWNGEDPSLNKDKIASYKSISSSQMDKLRSALHIVVTTKINTLMQNISSIIEILKTIIQNNTRLINATNRLPPR